MTERAALSHGSFNLHSLERQACSGCEANKAAQLVEDLHL